MTLLLCALIAGSSVWADEVTLAYKTATTTNMTGNNDAATVGLDASEWSVVGSKGSASNNVGLNKAGQIRLYYNAGGSNVMTVSSLVGTTINSITVNYGTETKSGTTTHYNGGVVKVGANTISDTNDDEDVGQYAINSTSFSIENGNSSNVQVWILSIVINYTPSGTPKVAKPVISGDEIFLNSTEVTITCGTDGATIQYSLDDGANWEIYENPFTITETKTVKAKASKKDMEDSDVATKLFNMKTALTVTRALGQIATLEDGETMPNEFVSGKISQIGTYSSGSITYWISDDGTTTSQLQVYKGKGLNGANFTAASDLALGSDVIVFGTLKNYNGTTPEFDAGSKLISYTPSETPVPTLTVSKTSLTGFTYVEGNGPSEKQTFDVTGTNLTGDVTFDLGESSYYEISVSAGTGFATNLVINKAEANPKTIYVRLKDGLDVNASYNGTITIASEGATSKTVTLEGSVTEYVPDYATLPFEWDDTTTPTGITNSGVGTYGSSPYLKFDGTGDYVILKFNERPGVLTFDIKGNSFSDGTFTVQTSEDGVTYSDLKAYTKLSSTQNESFDNLGENVRYIKWIYTAKVNGNVALGNIALAKYAAVPKITVNPATVNATAAETDGTLAISYKNLTINDMDDFDIQYYDAENKELTEGPSWIDVEVAKEDPTIGEGYVVSYVIGENNGEARTAYLKVYALDDETNIVYSNLITISQAAYVAPQPTVTYSLASSITPGKRYVIASGTDENGKAKVMGTQNTNNRAAVEGSVTGNTLTVNADAGAYEFVIYGPNANGNYTIYDETNLGYLYAASSSSNLLKTQKTNTTDGKWNITFDRETNASIIVAQGENTRNQMRYNSSNDIFSCYGSGQQPIYLYEKDGDTPVPTTTSVKLNAKGFATFASTSVLDFLDADAANFKAWEATSTDGSAIKFTKITSTIKTGTGILLYGTPEASININILPVGGETLSDNLLEGFTEATEIAANEYFGLSGNEFVKVGAGTIPAGKALLPASALSSGVKAFTFDFGENPDGIASPLGETEEGAIYNLAGQRLNKMQKGINIVNGKKVLK